MAEDKEVWKLNAAQSEALVETLLNPPEPSAALRAAAARYKQMVVDRPDTASKTDE